MNRAESARATVRWYRDATSGGPAPGSSLLSTPSFPSLLAPRYSHLFTPYFSVAHAKSHSRHHRRAFFRNVSRTTQDGAGYRRTRAEPADSRREHQSSRPRPHWLLQILREQTHSGAWRRRDDLPEDARP